LVWSPDGKTVASAALDGIRFWAVASGKEVRTILSRNISHIALSPDGKTIVSIGPDGLKVWDVINGKPLRSLKGHQGRVKAVAWSPNGQTVASLGNDNAIQLWAGSVDSLLNQARRQIPHFTPSTEECQSYFKSNVCRPLP
jgi:WD40 repeat protein